MPLKEPEKIPEDIQFILQNIDELWGLYKDMTIENMSPHNLQVIIRVINMKEAATDYRADKDRELNDYNRYKEQERISESYNSPA